MTVHERPDRLDKRPDRPNGRDGGDGLPPGAGERDLPPSCPDAERLAEYADGLLDAAERAAVEAHLVTCPDCRFTIVETMAFLAAEAAPAADGTAGDTAGDIVGDTESVKAAAIGTAPESSGPVGEEPISAGPVGAAPVGAAPVSATPDATPLADAAATSGDTSASSPTAPVRVVPFRKRSWVTGVGATLAAAAALVLIVRIASPAWLPSWLPSWLGGGPSLEGLVAALENQRVRPVEGRLMGGGGFPYKPAPSPTRGGTDRLGRGWSSDVSVETATIEKFAEGNTSARARAALGVALIVDGELDAAITALEQAAKDLPDDPAVHVNLSSAYLARARWWNHPEDWPKALDAADRAIRLDASAPEPYFNRALALEGLEQTDRAAQAWADYASRDRDSGWAREAEERRKALAAHQPQP